MFGEQLKKCRKLGKPKILQKELANIIHKDPSVISKLESRDPEKSSKVAPLNIIEITAISNYLREREVPEEEITKLKEAAKNNAQIGGNAKEYTDQLLLSIQQTLDEFESPESAAIREELSNAIYFWREYKLVVEKFTSGKITFGQAEDKLTQILDDGSFRGGSRLKARILMYRGIYRGYQAKVSRAQNDFNEALSLLNQVSGSDPSIQSKLLIELGDLYRRQDSTKWNDALQYYESARGVLEPFRGEVANSIIERKIASVYLYAGQAKKALDACNRSLKIARKCSDREAERKALEHKAWALGFLGHLDEALDLQNEAHSLARKLNVHPKEFSKSYRYLGDYYALGGFYVEALSKYEDALKENDRILGEIHEGRFEKEIVLRGWILLGMGNVMIHLVDKKVDAQKVLNEALYISDDLEDKVADGLCRLRLGELYMYDEDLGFANKQFESAKKAFGISGLSKIGETRLANPYYYTVLYLDLAEMMLRQGKIQDSLSLAEEAQKLAVEYGYAHQKVESILMLAAITLNQQPKNIEGVEKYYNQAIDDTVKISTLLLNVVLNKILDQLKMHGRNHPEQSKIISTKIMNDWNNYFSVKSKERKEYYFLKKWIEIIEYEILRWETLQITSK